MSGSPAVMFASHSPARSIAQAAPGNKSCACHTTIDRSALPIFLAFVATEPEGRFEFDGEQIVEMTGDTIKHNVLTKRIAAILAPEIATKGIVSLRWQALDLPLAKIYDNIVD